MEIKHLENIAFWHMYRSLRKSNNLQYSFAMDWGEESVDKTRAQLLSGYDRTCCDCQWRLQMSSDICFLMIIDTNCTQGCCES